MPKKIRLTRTEVWEYVPEFDSDFYMSEKITTIEDAMKADQKDIEKSEISVLELADEPVSTNYKWEIIDDEE